MLGCDCGCRNSARFCNGITTFVRPQDDCQCGYSHRTICAGLAHVLVSVLVPIQNDQLLGNSQGVLAATLQAVHIHLFPLVVTGIVVDGHLFVHCTVVIAQLVQI